MHDDSLGHANVQPVQFEAYSGYFLGLHDNIENARTHFMFVFVRWEPHSGEFQKLHLKVQPMSELKTLFGGNSGQSMQAEVEQAQREGHVLIQYLTANMTVEPPVHSIAFICSGAWERNNSLELERKLERKCYAAAPFAGDYFYKKLLDEGYTRLAAQEILNMQGIHRSPLYR